MLAERLGISPVELQTLLDGPDNYLRWPDKKTGRLIQQPKPRLALVHSRVANRLACIDTPDFLHSAVKGRSYITNARGHDPHQRSVKIDLKKFYPSTRIQAVYHFFRDRMCCSGDAAGMLAKLLTVDGHLATGSSVSPILLYFAYEDMFLALEALALRQGTIMTCYVDDMVFTGPGATRRLLHEAVAIIRNYRFRGHKMKTFSRGEVKIITGVAVTHVGGRLPNAHQVTIASEHDRLLTLTDPAKRFEALNKLVGRIQAAAQVDPAWKPRATEYLREKRALAHLSEVVGRAGRKAR